jgi:hypothetical protein
VTGLTNTYAPNNIGYGLLGSLLGGVGSGLTSGLGSSLGGLSSLFGGSSLPVNGSSGVQAFYGDSLPAGSQLIV